MSTIFPKKGNILFIQLSLKHLLKLIVLSTQATLNISSTALIVWELRKCNYWTKVEIKSFWKIRIENHNTYRKQAKLYSEIHNLKIVILMSQP